MLLETTFRVGGAVCLLAGALLLAVFATEGLAAAYFEVYLSPVMFFVLGAIFLYVAAGAARERQELLRLGLRGDGQPESGESPGARRT